MSERLDGLTIEEWRLAAMTEHADLLDCRAERARIEAEALPSVERLVAALVRLAERGLIVQATPMINMPPGGFSIANPESFGDTAAAILAALRDKP